MDNTALLLARIQFGVTLTYHFLFVALTLGLSVLIAMMETLYVRTGDQLYKAMAKFWGKLFLVNYAVAIVTGLVNEFQFGMNWSEYSRFVGSVFGPPLAFEALTAFFVESVAIGIWVYGWDEISPTRSSRRHLAGGAGRQLFGVLDSVSQLVYAASDGLRFPEWATGID